MIQALRNKLHSPMGSANPPTVVSLEKISTFAELVDYYNLADYIVPPVPRDSLLMQEGASAAIAKWIPNCPTTPELLFRATRDGFDAATFHKLADGKAPTVTLVRSTEGYIFGGYTDAAWTSTNAWIASNNSFLFSLKNPLKLPAMKFELKATANAIMGHTSQCSQFGSDLIVHGGSNSQGVSLNLGNQYELPAGLNGQTFLSGAGKVMAEEVEVFQLKPL